MRFVTRGVLLPGFAAACVSVIVEHAWMEGWIAAAKAGKWELAAGLEPRR